VTEIDLILWTTKTSDNFVRVCFAMADAYLIEQIHGYSTRNDIDPDHNSGVD